MQATAILFWGMVIPQDFLEKKYKEKPEITVERRLGPDNIYFSFDKSIEKAKVSDEVTWGYWGDEKGTEESVHAVYIKESVIEVYDCLALQYLPKVNPLWAVHIMNTIKNTGWDLLLIPSWHVTVNVG